MASSTSPEAAVEDGKGPTASARCTIVAPRPAARPCRVPGLPAALVEVMLSDLPHLLRPPRPAGWASAFGASKCLALGGFHRDGDLRGMAPRPV